MVSQFKVNRSLLFLNSKQVLTSVIKSSSSSDLKEDLMGTKFLLYFIIFVKYVVYNWGLGAQVLHMTDSKLHLF